MDKRPILYGQVPAFGVAIRLSRPNAPPLCDRLSTDSSSRSSEPSQRHGGRHKGDAVEICVSPLGSRGRPVSVECCDAVTLILQRHSVTAFNGQDPASQRSTSSYSVTAFNGQPTAQERSRGRPQCYRGQWAGQSTASQRSTSSYSVTAFNEQITALQRHSVTASQRQARARPLLGVNKLPKKATNRGEA